MSNTAGPSIPAGWYRDPGGSDQLRWWDGTAWTAHLAPSPTPVVQAPVVQAPVVQPPVVQVPVVQEQQYVPFQNAWSSGEVQFARPVAWNTAGAWLLATSVFWTAGIGFLAGAILAAALGSKSVEVGGRLSTIGIIAEVVVSIIAWVLMVVAAAGDNASLKRHGYLRPTSVLWILLVPPLVYLIIRTVRVRSESGRGAAPLVFYIVSTVAIYAIAIVASIALAGSLAGGGILNPATNAANATSLASGITTGLERNGGSYSVTCTSFAKPISQPVNVSCAAIDLATKQSHTLIINIEPGVAGADPTVKLLSVTPPISK